LKRQRMNHWSSRLCAITASAFRFSKEGFSISSRRALYIYMPVLDILLFAHPIGREAYFHFGFFNKQINFSSFDDPV
jgi:hypothetical protein